MKIGFFGVNLSVKKFSGVKECLITAFAGPCVSFVLFLLSMVIRKFLKCETLAFFEFANLCIGLANLIPALPLDGGVIVKGIIQGRAGIIAGERIMKKLTLSMCFLFWGICILTALAKKINLSLMFFSVFLLYSATRENERYIFEKKCVLCGEIRTCKKIRYIPFDCESDLLSVASKISPSYFLIVPVFDEGRFIGEINQIDIPGLMKTKGGLCVLKDCF